MEITVRSTAPATSARTRPDKITGVYKVTDVTLKRGVMGDDTLYTWLDQIRNGNQPTRCAP